MTSWNDKIQIHPTLKHPPPSHTSMSTMRSFLKKNPGQKKYVHIINQWEYGFVLNLAQLTICK